jgi:hypothetical protein
MVSYVMIHFHCTHIYVIFYVHIEIASHTTFINFTLNYQLLNRCICLYCTHILNAFSFS